MIRYAYEMKKLLLYEEIFDSITSPSQIPESNSSLPETINNLTFTEERNKRDESKQFSTMYFTAISVFAKVQYIREKGHELLL